MKNFPSKTPMSYWHGGFFILKMDIYYPEDTVINLINKRKEE
jgi:hypothetical protein